MSDGEHILKLIKAQPGCTALDLAHLLQRPGEDLYDAHRRISWVIAHLRKNKTLVDVPRCAVCGRALTRTHRNVPLYPTTP